MTKSILIDGFWAGEFGSVEFVELGLEAGMSLTEIHQVLSDVSDEDGTTYDRQIEVVRRAMA